MQRLALTPSSFSGGSLGAAAPKRERCRRSQPWQRGSRKTRATTSSSQTATAATSTTTTGETASGNQRLRRQESTTSARYDLRHTCATLLVYSGWTVNEIAEHVGHTDPGFSARTYQHTLEDAPQTPRHHDQRSNRQRTERDSRSTNRITQRVAHTSA
jgi:integrase